MEAKYLLGLTLCSNDTGAALGRVEELLFDAGRRRLWALRARVAGAPTLLPMEAVYALTPDAVILPTASDLLGPIVPLRQGPVIDLRSLLRTTAVTTDGNRLGRVAEVEVYPLDGRITALTIVAGGFLGLGVRSRTISATKIHQIERDRVIIDDRLDPEPAAVPGL